MPLKHYGIKPIDALSIHGTNMALGTTRFLPSIDQIPEAFVHRSAAAEPYVTLCEAFFHGTELPDVSITILDGFTPATVSDCVCAHLASPDPEYGHKLAGVAFMFSKMATCTPQTPFLC